MYGSLLNRKRLTILGLLAAVLLSAGSARAADREVVRRINIPDGDLAKKFSVNEVSGRHYAGYTWKAEKGQRLELHIYSSDHEPEILIFAADFNGKATGMHLAKSTAEKPYRHPDTKRLVYYASVVHDASADATYRAIFTHVGEKKPGEWRLEGTVFGKAQEADLRPTISGYQMSPWGDPDKPARPNGTKSIGANHDIGRDRGLQMFGDWVPAGGSAAADWDAFAKLGGGNDLYRKGLVKEEAVGNLIYRTMRSGGKDVVIVSPTKKAFVFLSVYSKFAADESKFIDAGKRMLAALEERSADR